jgi:hypothetical protein
MFDKPSIASEYYRYFQVRDEIEWWRGLGLVINSFRVITNTSHHSLVLYKSNVI